jgi:hypothetical protein
MKQLKDIYAAHVRKVSDKWTIYLDEYEEKFAKYRDIPVKILEIGIQNGGSLDIYLEYFSNAEKILGCDINPNCHKLEYLSKKIDVIVGDANSKQVKEGILSHGKFDIIIDDGSHTSFDIVNNFCNYFDSLKLGGLYVIEDLHCSYWDGFDGGLFHPISSMTFLKKLVDIVNYEHWGLPLLREHLLTNFSSSFGVSFDKLPLSMIHSIEFVNSLCFIRKADSVKNEVGPRVIAGNESLVEPPHPEAYDQIIRSPSQQENFYANRTYLPENELVECYNEIQLLQARIKVLEET